MSQVEFNELGISNRRFYLIVLFIAGFLLTAGYAFSYMGAQGHFVTGMSNKVVWGLPHVIAIFLIIAAAGVVSIASLGSVFKRPDYQPYERISLVLAMSLLLGGLLLILLDLGRADRLIIALTHFNFDSVFAWNILRYFGFFVIMSLYLWSMMDRTSAAKRYYQPLSYLALIWSIVLAAGAGSIFGVLVAREYYDFLTIIPLFIISAYLIGTGCFSLVLLFIYKLERRQVSDEIKARLVSSLLFLVLIMAAFEVVRHLLNHYVFGKAAAEAFILKDGGGITAVFWIGQCFIGLLLPLALLVWSGVRRIAWASSLIVLGGLSQLYVTIIGGQLQAMRLFPNAMSESQIVGDYSISFFEIALSLGGIAAALFVFIVAAKVLRIIPLYFS